MARCKPPRIRNEGMLLLCRIRKQQDPFKDLALEEAICSSYPENFFCPIQPETNDAREKERGKAKIKGKETKPPCTPNLCYTASLVVRGKVYSMERQCINVANQYPTTPHRRDSGASSTSRTQAFILLLIVRILQEF